MPQQSINTQAKLSEIAMNYQGFDHIMCLARDIF